MITEEVKKSLKNRYNKIHPLLFQRSCEYAHSGGELFDILESLESSVKLPCVWDQKTRRWVTLEDLTCVKFPEIQEG